MEVIVAKIPDEDVKMLRMHYQLSYSQARALWLLGDKVLVTREDIEGIYTIYGSAKQLMWNLRQALFKANHDPKISIKSKGYLGWWLDPEDQVKIRALTATNPAR
jgi:hypothetical protein